MDVHSHVFFVLCLFQLTKVKVLKGLLEELDVERIAARISSDKAYLPKEDGDVVDLLVNAHVMQDFVTQIENVLNDCNYSLTNGNLLCSSSRSCT